MEHDILQHPDITSALATGYPRGHCDNDCSNGSKVDEDGYLYIGDCPVCGREIYENTRVYKISPFDIIACYECLYATRAERGEIIFQC